MYPSDTVESVLVVARIRFNDAIGNGIAGQTITDANPISLPMTNAAWRRLQDALAIYGSSELKQETIFFTLPPGGGDPSSQQSINWTTTPPLPDDMISPLSFSERVSALGGNFYPMDQYLNGLPRTSKTNLNKAWEWRHETVVVPGATVSTDMCMRYMAYLPDFVSNSPIPATPWYSQIVPMVRVLNPFAWFMCSEVCKGRGDMDAAYFDDQAMAAVEGIFDRDAAQARAVSKPSEYGKMRTPLSNVTGSGVPGGAVKVGPGA